MPANAFALEVTLTRTTMVVRTMVWAGAGLEMRATEEAHEGTNAFSLGGSNGQGGSVRAAVSGETNAGGSRFAVSSQTPAQLTGRPRRVREPRSGGPRATGLSERRGAREAREDEVASPSAG